LETARERARQIAELPPKAVQAAKACLYRSVDNDLETAPQLTAALQATVQHTDEHDDAVQSILERLGTA